MNLEIGNILPEDTDDFFELARTFYAHEKLPFDSAAMQNILAQLWDQPQRGAVFLAKADGHAIGYLVLTHCFSLEFGGGYVLLDEIFVLPDHRGRGIGRRLLDYAADYSRAQGSDVLRLEVKFENLKAKQVYEKFGFQAESRTLMRINV